MASNMTYGCVILNIDILPNRYFLNFFILSLVEIPANCMVWIGTQYLGRRLTTFLTFTSCAIVSMITCFYVEGISDTFVLVCFNFNIKDMYNLDINSLWRENCP